MGKQKKLTFIIVPNGTEKTKRFSIGSSALKTGAAVVSTLVLVFVFLVYEFLHQQYQGHELLKTKKLVVEQNNQLMDFANKIHTLQTKLESLQQFDMKIRILANIQSPASKEENTYSIGGPTFDTGGYPVPLSGVSRGMLVKKIKMDIDELLSKTGMEERSLQEVYENILDKKDLLLATPSIWPTRGFISSGFGYRINPITGGKEFHEGIDIATQLGNHVLAPSNGIVSFAGPDDGYGLAIIIDHGYGITTLYGHLSKLDVKAGEIVTRGQVIGNVGDTGFSTGPHLHYEVMINGIPINPIRYMVVNAQ
ncbi:MAG: M23 family metallopeptidase [Deltaproteobacteria bacterium]|nr:M23 family metallopeptidase [Deltaproteobacteria bacterium]